MGAEVGVGLKEKGANKCRDKFVKKGVSITSEKKYWQEKLSPQFHFSLMLKMRRIKSKEVFVLCGFFQTVRFLLIL